MTINANDQDEYAIRLPKGPSKQKRKIPAQREGGLFSTGALLALARQLGHRSPWMTLPYISLSYCKRQPLTYYCKEILQQFQMEGEADNQKEEQSKEQPETSGDET